LRPPEWSEDANKTQRERFVRAPNDLFTALNNLFKKGAVADVNDDQTSRGESLAEQAVEFIATEPTR